jgi:ribosomal-protein-alanine N-acetyltransferase
VIKARAIQVVETDHLILRKFSIEDAPFILELLNQPAWLRFIGDRSVRTIEDAERYIRQGPMESYERLGFGLWLTELKDGLVPIGMCGLIKRESLEDVDIGYALLPEFWSKGYAFEAACAAMEYGKRVLKLERIVAIVTPDNERSIKLLERIGLKFESTLREPDGSELYLYS